MDISLAIPLLGIFVFLFISWLISENRRHIPWRTVISGLLLLFSLGWVFLSTPWGKNFQHYSGSGISILLDCSEQGALMLFSEKLVKDPSFICTAISVSVPIIFIGSLSAVLFHLGVLQWVIRFFAFIVTRTMGVSGEEAVIAAANIFVGMVEAPFAVRPYLSSFTRSQLFCMMTSGMASIAGGVMCVYAGLLQQTGTPPGHLVIASILSVFSAILIAKIMIPETAVQSSESGLGGKLVSQDVNILDAASRGASEGLAIALSVCGTLAAFVALIALSNHILALIPNLYGEPITLQRLFGVVFWPAAWLMGIPPEECCLAGQLLGEKTVFNEFYAYMDMTQNTVFADTLSARSRVILTYALCGFANFGSLAIMIGGLGTLIPDRRREIVQLAFPALISGTLAAFITACLAAMFG